MEHDRLIDAVIQEMTAVDDERARPERVMARLRTQVEEAATTPAAGTLDRRSGVAGLRVNPRLAWAAAAAVLCAVVVGATWHAMRPTPRLAPDTVVTLNAARTVPPLTPTVTPAPAPVPAPAADLAPNAGTDTKRRRRAREAAWETPAFARAEPLPIASIDPDPLPVPAALETTPVSADAIAFTPIRVGPFDEDVTLRSPRS